MTATAIPSPMFAGQSMTEYMVDASQRTVLYWDVMRRRGNQYLKHMARTVPHVLQFEYELIVDGSQLSQPVNYGLVRIKPPEGIEVDDRNRPFIVIDPRAGHGPGIGGFKPHSEIGEALSAGHPCYFIGFSPKPEPGQTIETVIDAWAVFVEQVVQRHPEAKGKPVLVGNCQAGWALLMLSAKHPGLCGPIIAAGSPVSYWAGMRGINPMRYSGGMLAGSWLTALTSDVGNGKFDGAWLVSNFENLNPANTLWNKQYNLYANIDSETQRYLGFERWWGGHVLLSADEIQYIVDNLFVGNKLSNAQLITSDGIRLDLRKISSPIICLCSKGDNITPPQQALDWILDMYGSDDDIMAAGQTIIYTVHETIGHLGIFVSSSVAKKEHKEFTSNIEMIDCLPPGLWEAVMEKKGEKDANADLISGEYISRFERRTLNDIRALGGNTPEEDRCFATVARLSEVTHGLYRSTIQPAVRAMANETSAEWLRRLHPLRLAYELWSDRNPTMQPLSGMADQVLKNRQKVSADNPFLQWEHSFSDWMTYSLNAFRDWRDQLIDYTFFGIYSQPWLQALLGQRASDAPARSKPGIDPDRADYVRRQIEELKAKMDQGGCREAMIRAMLYIRWPEKFADERNFEMLRRIRTQKCPEQNLSEFKQNLRDQYFMLRLDEPRAMKMIPELLKGHEDEAERMYNDIKRIVTADGPLHEKAQERLAKVERIFVSKRAVPQRRAKKKTSARKNDAKDD